MTTVKPFYDYFKENPDKLDSLIIIKINDEYQIVTGGTNKTLTTPFGEKIKCFEIHAQPINKVEVK